MLFGETAGFWIQTVALIASALGAISLIYSNGRATRRRATVAHIIHQESNPELLKAIAVVYKLQRTGVPLAEHLTNEDSPEFQAILKVLNHYEFVALGIRRKAFDESIYKYLQCANIRKAWRKTSGIVGTPEPGRTANAVPGIRVACDAMGSRAYSADIDQQAQPA
ncbi:MAG: DUF4760 domain-containing protein [Zoogloeaceae bacterium]|jgi:hypothetical protein|nr:DUF4760 domain-containing protein [Zoogloeaceae bacterium]